MKTVETILSVILSIFFLTSAQAQNDMTPGTGVANGAGGQPKPEGWIPVGPFGNLKGSIQRTIDLEEFSKKYVVALNFCSEHKDLLFPPMPVELNSRILFQNSNSQPLNMKEICKDERLLRVYIPLVFAFYTLQENPVFNYLISSSIAVDPKPIIIKLFKARKSVAARGGKIEEESWFNESDGSIGWGPIAGIDSVIEGFFKRCESSLVLHELAHVWSYRILGGYRSMPFWHDARFKMEEYSKENGISVRSKSNFYQFETGEYQAFIEGLSNLVELSMTTIHPMVDFNAVQSFYPDFQDPKSGIYHAFGGGRFNQSREKLLSNEAFVSSVLSEFVGDYEVRAGEENVLSVANVQKIVDLLKAFEKSKTPELIALMKSYDQMQNSNQGWRLIREYLLFDYTTNQELGADLTVRTDVRDWVFGGSAHDSTIEILTNEKYPSATLYSPIKHELRDRAYELLQKKNAEVVSRQSLQRLLRRLLTKSDGQWAEFQILQPELKNRIDAVSPIISDYTTAFDGKRREALDTVETIYAFASNQRRRLLSEMTIEAILKDLKNSADAVATYTAELTEYSNAVRSLSERVDRTLELSTSDSQHRDDFQAYEDLEAKKLNFFDALVVIEALESMRK